MKEISIRHGGGRMANRMMQYLAATSLAEGHDGCAITGHDIPEWSMTAPSSRGFRRWPRVDVQSLDVDWLRAHIAARGVERIRLTGIVADVSAFPSRARAGEIFAAPAAPYYETDERHLVIHIRLGDVMVPGRHRGYGPLPIDWYKTLIAETGLHPVFVGQLGDDLYSQALRAQFPAATFLQGGSALYDFQTLRHARHVVLAISTFSWLAAWMGAAQTIHYPIIGVFNPLRHAMVRLTPRGDDRYRYAEFPLRRWLADPAAIEAVIHAPSTGRPIGRERLEEILRRADEARARALDAWKARFAEQTAP